jgi:coproporphyrinogen III oxidase-like Fe-S oxidoreductase
MLEARVPELEGRFRSLREFGLYLHIPFCRQICPYCPYNKQLYHPETASRYADALLLEIDFYSSLAGDIPVTSFYIGGGTPTTMLDSGLDRVLDRIYEAFNMQCGIHMESHPNDLTLKNLERMRSMGVEYLSIGVEALQDYHLQALHRPYTVEHVKRIVARARSVDFRCINADLIFALPGQTFREVEEAGRALVKMGIDQVAAYPLFTFPYTAWSSIAKRKGYREAGVFKKRKMLGILERIFYEAGFLRTSVWAFTKPEVEKYCSVTVPLYIGLGASGGSYLKDVLYFNTFNVEAYIKALLAGRVPIALAMKLSRRMQMAGWLYWRIYETAFKPIDFRRRFGLDFDSVYGAYFGLFSLLGFIKENEDQIVLSDRGAYWLHVLQDLFSIDYVSRLWGNSRNDPWPSRVVL